MENPLSLFVASGELKKRHFIVVLHDFLGQLSE
jgi:hypothetical protein